MIVNPDVACTPGQIPPPGSKLAGSSPPSIYWGAGRRGLTCWASFGSVSSREEGENWYAPCKDVSCKILKANQATSRIPVIFLTAEESVDLNQGAFEAGAQATVLKSMSQDRLMNIVDVFIPTARPAVRPDLPIPDTALPENL